MIRSATVRLIDEIQAAHPSQSQRFGDGLDSHLRPVCVDESDLRGPNHVVDPGVIPGILKILVVVVDGAGCSWFYAGCEKGNVSNSPTGASIGESEYSEDVDRTVEHHERLHRAPIGRDSHDAHALKKRNVSMDILKIATGDHGQLIIGIPYRRRPFKPMWSGGIEPSPARLP